MLCAALLARKPYKPRESCTRTARYCRLYAGDAVPVCGFHNGVAYLDPDYSRTRELPPAEIPAAWLPTLIAAREQEIRDIANQIATLERRKARTFAELTRLGRVWGKATA